MIRKIPCEIQQDVIYCIFENALKIMPKCRYKIQFSESCDYFFEAYSLERELKINDSSCLYINWDSIILGVDAE